MKIAHQNPFSDKEEECAKSLKAEEICLRVWPPIQLVFVIGLGRMIEIM